jgi:DNA-binding NtrC family response regulator
MMEKANLSEKLNVLVVDDEPEMAELMRSVLKQEPYLKVDVTNCGEDALMRLESEPVDIIVSDIKMPGTDGFMLLEALKESNSLPLAIMVTALNDAGSARRCLKLGAYDYMIKPLNGDELIHTIRKAAESLELQRENEYLWDMMDSHWSLDKIIGKSEVMQNIFKVIHRAAQTEATVLIKGETGTGKELVARAIHNLSRRRTKNFVVIDCNAFSKELLSSELFGHTKGAFTGAFQSKKGLLELASGGTAFFDEIGDIDLALQPKLLRVLQRGEFRRVGDTKLVDVNLRVVAATNQPLGEWVEESKFRADLYYRLNVIPIHLPPLRERIEDVPLLIQHFTTKASSELQIKPKVFSTGAVEAMMAYSWPGNIRELENEVARLMALCPKDEVAEEDLSSKLVKSGASPRLLVSKKGMAEQTYKKAKRLFVDTFQYNYIKAQLEKHNGNISKASSASGMERRTFQRLMKKFTFSRSDFSQMRLPRRNSERSPLSEGLALIDKPLSPIAASGRGDTDYAVKEL